MDRLDPKRQRNEESKPQVLQLKKKPIISKKESKKLKEKSKKKGVKEQLKEPYESGQHKESG